MHPLPRIIIPWRIPSKARGIGEDHRCVAPVGEVAQVERKGQPSFLFEGPGVLGVEMEEVVAAVTYGIGVIEPLPADKLVLQAAGPALGGPIVQLAGADGGRGAGQLIAG